MSSISGQASPTCIGNAVPATGESTYTHGTRVYLQGVGTGIGKTGDGAEGREQKGGTSSGLVLVNLSLLIVDYCTLRMH